MSFIHKSGKVTTEFFPKVASTAFTNLSVVGFSGAGGSIAPITTASTRVVGIIQKTIASTDSDYASTTEVPVIIPTPETVFLADVSTGTATTANIGKRYDLASSTGVDLSATTTKVLTVVGFVSSTQVLIKFNRNYMNADTNVA